MTVRRKVTFWPVTPPGDPLGAPLAADPASITGNGGWVIVARPKGKGLTEWQGYDPYRMVIPIFFGGFDDYKNDISQEGNIEMLRRLMRVPYNGQPTVLKVEGPVPLTQLQWVIENLEFVSEERRNSDGERVRSFINVHLLEYVAPNIVVASKITPVEVVAEAAESSAESISSTTYIVRSGDTLSGIAANHLGSAKRWPEIAKLNELRNPNLITVGQELRLP